MQKKLATAMGVFCANLGADIKLYIEPVMVRLIAMVQSGNTELADHAVLAIHSVAFAAKEDFAPFYELTVKIVGTLMAFTQGIFFIPLLLLHLPSPARHSCTRVASLYNPTFRAQSRYSHTFSC